MDKHMRKDSHSQTVRTTPGNHQKYPERAKIRTTSIHKKKYMKKHRINNTVVTKLPHPISVVWE